VGREGSASRPNQFFNPNFVEDEITYIEGSVGNIDTYTIGPAFYSEDNGSGSFVLGQSSETPRLDALRDPETACPRHHILEGEAEL